MKKALATIKINAADIHIIEEFVVDYEECLEIMEIMMKPGPTTPPGSPRLLTLAQAAVALGMSDDGLNELLAKGEGPATTLDTEGNLAISIQVIDDFLPKTRRAYLDATQLALESGKSEDQLAKLRNTGGGPPWKEFQGIILYPANTAYAWIYQTDTPVRAFYL